MAQDHESDWIPPEVAAALIEHHQTSATKQAPQRPSWAQQIADRTAQDKRAQPWKAALGETHDRGTEGEDWINLKLPNHVQCGSLAA